MDLKKRYYDYAKKHTEEELWRLFNEDLKNNVNSGSDYFSHKQNVIMTYVFLVLCRNSGIDKFLMKDNQLNKLANDSKFQFLARKFFDYSIPLDKLEIYFSENV